MLAAVVLILMASQTGALSSLRHVGLGPAQAPAPANSAHSNVDHQSFGSGSQMSLPATDSAPQSSATSGNPAAAVKSGGPEDAGPDVVGQSPAGKTSACAPRVCRR
jgi:hypothetical protein